MKYQAPGKCPVCGERLAITKLNCPKCTTTIEGEFRPCEFCRLAKDELEFIKIFIKSRGNIKDVEKELSISYPTVRSKLDSVINSLGYKVDSKSQKEIKESKDLAKKEILEALSKGDITAKQATDKINKLK